MNTFRRLTGSAALIALAVLWSNLWGQFRESLSYATFDPGSITAYGFALKVPFEAPQVINNALAAALVPVLVGLWRAGNYADARRLARGIVVGAALVLTPVALLGALFSADLLRITWSYHQGGAGTASLVQAERLSRLLFPYLLISGIGGAVASTLQAYERFRALALGQLVPNVVIVVCVVLLHQRLGIASQGIGVVLGAVAYVLVLLPFFTRACARSSPGDGPIAVRWWWRLPAARQVGRGLVPLLLVGLADWGAGQWAVYRPITGLSLHNPGALLEFGSAYRVLQIPTGILVAALLTVLLPLLSEYASAGDTGGLAGAAVSGMRMVLFVVAPTAICLGCLALPILNVLYLHGRYLEHEVSLSTPLIALMAPFVVINGVSEVLILVLLATRRVWLLLVLQAISLAIAAGLCRGMAAMWGLLGLAAAVSLTACASMGLLFWGVGVTVPLARALVRVEPVRLGRGALPGAGRQDLGAFAWKMGIVSIGLWLFLFAFTHAWAGAGAIQGPRRNIQEVALGMGAALAIYAGMAQRLRIPEWLALRDMVIHRLRREGQAEAVQGAIEEPNTGSGEEVK